MKPLKKGDIITFPKELFHDGKNILVVRKDKRHFLGIPLGYKKPYYEVCPITSTIPKPFNVPTKDMSTKDIPATKKIIQSLKGKKIVATKLVENIPVFSLK